MFVSLVSLIILQWKYNVGLVPQNNPVQRFKYFFFLYCSL